MLRVKLERTEGKIRYEVLESLPLLQKTVFRGPDGLMHTLNLSAGDSGWVNFDAVSLAEKFIADFCAAVHELNGEVDIEVIIAE